MKKYLVHTVTGSPFKLSARASSVWIQLVKLQIKHFIISLDCFWMSTYKEGCSCGLLIKMLFSVQSRVPQASCKAHLTLHWELLSAQVPCPQGHKQVLQCPHTLSWLQKLQVHSLPKSGNAVIMLPLEEEYYLPQVFFYQVTENRTWRNLQRSNSPIFPGSLSAIREGGNTDNHQSYYSHGIAQL